MKDADRQLRQLAKHKDSTVRARASVLGELFASLESQNQALQEERDVNYAEVVARGEEIGRLYAERRTLRERAERAEAPLAWIAANEVDPLDGGRVAQLQAMIDRARNALSPTQETDRPKPRTGIAHGPGNLAQQSYETDFGTPRPTQETDPE